MSIDEETTRERVVRVAAQLFASKGYHATGVAELAEAANLGKGALYYHIGSKQDLLFEISKRHIEEALEYGREVVSSGLSPEEKVRRLARRHMRMLSDHLDEVTIYLRERHALTGARRRHINEISHRYQQMWEAVMEEGAALGVFRGSDPIVVRGILGMLNYSYMWLDPNGELSPEAIADRLSDLILCGELAQPPTAFTPNTGSDVEPVAPAHSG